MAWPALSGDGNTLAFEWLNDIWIAAGKGGKAVRITTDPARDSYPKFSSDGMRIVFSSERSGSMQVHSVKMDGSDARQHSANTEGYTLEDVSSDGAYALARGQRECSGYKSTRLLKVNLRKDARELMLFDATSHSVSISSDGSRFLFCRGGEQPFRDGYMGSRASQIHLYDMADDSFRSIVDEKWEARSPKWRPDGKGFLYLSNESGAFNIHSHQLGAGSGKQLTFFRDDSVVAPALSGDGKVMVFRAGQAIYRYEPGDGSSPEKIHLFTDEKLPDRCIREEKVTGTSSVAFSQDGKSVVFSAAGDLWAMGSGAKEPVRLTETDDRDEREPQLSQDGKRLYFLGDDGLNSEVCVVPWSDMAMGEVVVLKASDRSKRSLRLSPDGSRVSWIEATGDLVTSPVSGMGGKTVMHCWDMPTYDWSPDGRWLVVAAKDIHSNRDIWIVPADGVVEPVNLTMHPAFEGSPKWSPDGNKIVFVARREPDGLARMWVFAVDRLLGGKMPEDEDFNVIRSSLKAIDTAISEPIRMAWTADSKTVLFQSRDTKDITVYSQPIDGGEVAEYADLRGVPAGLSENGAAFWRIDRVPCVYWGRMKEAEFRFGFPVIQDRSKRMKLGFRRIWRTLSERFYDETMNGKDWPAVLVKYEDAAAGSMDSRQFERVVELLLGELNVSHLTFRSTPWGLETATIAPKKLTAHPGVIFSNRWEGNLTVAGVVPGSPVSMAKWPPLPGETVLRIGGRDVVSQSPLERFFNGAKGVPLPIVIAGKDGVNRVLELIPISYQEARELDREGRVDSAHQAAGEYDIAYLPFRRMKSDDLRELEVEVYRASLDSDGLILDLRDNTGGRVADELLGMFCQPAHAFTIPRGGERGYPVDRRVIAAWDGPMVVLCNGNTFSNAEIFCHAFKRLGRGKLVGEQTNGGVISTVSVEIPEIGELQVPFRGWFDVDTGRDLELNGAVPDVVVSLGPGDQAEGNDPQLAAAIAILSKEIFDKSPRVKARIKSEREEK